MTEYRVPVTARIRSLVEDGVITIGVHITSDGMETYVRCTQPHPRLGITSHESMTFEDAELRLAKVSTSTSKYKGKGTLSEKEDTPSSQGASIHGFKDVLQASLKGKTPEVASYWKQGVKNFLPGDSLHPRDFDGSVRRLYSRACAVAERVGAPKLVSRIATKPDVYRINGATSLREWWYSATPQQRFALLTKRQCFPTHEGGGVMVHGKWLDLLRQLQCPFQDAEAKVGPPQGAVSAEEESYNSSSDDDLAGTLKGVSIEY
jgi:hypothetical protein